ncbi:M24 family metallopeptidase [Devosia sp. YIM 151766]|uniref:M24 family metallopeptidase n=1 Tax=Devosia sp. YIM 151766 TaxID=3017325 RepID=UPI00255CEFD6|nr:M24 family metallopeptidase [Devosia sp. YIM 151766]WIY52021.1 M24 family metallopeptidase [Devosia sp. YIM 151766]
MTVVLKEISVPDFGVPEARPKVPAATYEARVTSLINRAASDWVVVYADREHLANIAFLTGFEPRFEEALLLLGRNGERIIVTGNESIDYTPVAILPNTRGVLAQSFSLMGQDRSQSPDLIAILRECGISSGQSIALAGWKYLVAEEWSDSAPTFFVPAFVVDSLRAATGPSGRITDATAILMSPADGIRAIVDADEIAQIEWGSARSSAAVWKIVQGSKPGMSELQCAALMEYAGEPLNCHVMMSSATAPEAVIGLRSPSARQIRPGDGVTTAVGYWGGLSCRAGLMADHDDAFLEKAIAYFGALRAWYETVDIGVAGKDVAKAVEAELATVGLRPALNPGHLISHDEWMNSPLRAGSEDVVKSGMVFQVDIIPAPMAAGQGLNCEDGVVIADEQLRARIAETHPEVYARMQARRDFMRDVLGITLKDCILPLSSTPLCFPPFWTKPNQLLVAA